MAVTDAMESQVQRLVTLTSAPLSVSQKFILNAAAIDVHNIRRRAPCS